MELTTFDPSALLNSAGEMEFSNLAQFNEGEVGAFWTNPGAMSPWEMHPDCDELLHVLEGKIEVEVLPLGSGEGVSKILEAGTFIVIPKGCWHRQQMLERTKELYLTPGPTLHSDADDPRL